MSATGIAGLKPAVSFLKIEGDHAWLAGAKCGKCGTVVVGKKDVCAKCFARDAMKEKWLDQDAPDRVARVERRHRVLEDHLHATP